MELTQILPVSIPRDSLRVSGLKDIQEHSAEDIKNTVTTVPARTPAVLGKSVIVLCHSDLCSAAVHFRLYHKDLTANSNNK